METKRCMRVWVVVVAVIAMCVLATVPADASYEDSLINYWNMDDLTGTAVTDFLNPSNNGIAQQDTSLLHIAGKTGGALTFNGSSDYIRIPTNSALNSLFDAAHSFTVSLWAKLENGQYDMTSLFSKGTEVLGSQGFHILPLRNTGYDRYDIDFIGPGGEVLNARYGTSTGYDGDWHNFVVTYDGSGHANGIEFYIDEQLQTWGSYSDVLPGLLGNTKDLYLGGALYWTVPFSGAMDDVAVWSRVLSGEEITGINAAGQTGQSLGDLMGGGSVPEPSSMAVIGLALAGLWGRRFRTKK